MTSVDSKVGNSSVGLEILALIFRLICFNRSYENNIRELVLESWPEYEKSLLPTEYSLHCDDIIMNIQKALRIAWQKKEKKKEGLDNKDCSTNQSDPLRGDNPYPAARER